MKINNYNPLRIMGENGWIWHHYAATGDTDDYECFTMEILGEYHTVVRACVSDYKFHGNKANRKRRNEKLRRLYRLEELENKHLSKEE